MAVRSGLNKNSGMMCPEYWMMLGTKVIDMRKADRRSKGVRGTRVREHKEKGKHHPT